MLANVYTALFFVGFLLQILVLQRLIHGAYKKYPLLLIYSLVLLATTVAEATRYFSVGRENQGYIRWYWINDTLLHTLLFLIVITFIYKALEGSPTRGSVARLLAVGAIAVIGVSLYLAYDFKKEAFINSGLRRTGANLDFSAALLNLALWSALLRQKKRDWQLLQLSGGVGIEVTGNAMAHSIRYMSAANSAWATVADLLAVIAHLLGLYIWWLALRPRVDRRSSPPLASTQNS